MTELAASGQVTLGEGFSGASEGKPLTLTQRAHEAETRAEAFGNEVSKLRSEINDLRYSTNEAHKRQINDLQNEVGMLRSMIARMTYGGVHVKQVDRVGPGAL